ncbi:MAG: hypothetical protein KAR05_08015 [Candidatus Omnitrophica bacterium]|nr:hypothetical protein [Candidatus Omnitrophota bacterium]
MKKTRINKVIVFLFSCLFLLILRGNFLFARENGLKRYLIEKAVVEYQIRGSQIGAEVMYFDNWGMREVKYKNARRRKVGMENIMTLMKDMIYYTVDLNKKIGTKIPNKLLEALIQEFQAGEAEDLGSAWMKKMGGEKIGTEYVADKLCDIWHVEKLGAKYWMWNWIPLRIKVRTGEELLMITATQVHEDVAIPEDKFKIPEKIYFMEGNLDDVILSRYAAFEKTSAS